MAEDKRAGAGSEEARIRQILEEWAHATRTGDRERVLINHEADVLIFDVLPPMQYDGAEAYRQSWDDWQPDTEGDFRFELLQLRITAGDDLGFAHGIIHCAGRSAGGRDFEDRVRATFCLRKQENGWRIAHQHISMPRAGA